ncbi:hypothetical protein mRhiFer1_008950 [Rhinolophus ferrumequinum]|uniref:Uncharacterized protein n=1 Tax=Rhinolophus ferrumequinum TaxID=59479 RepID=A0A7J7TEF1_RHIFE|nr:hypothetical protein mRhiFer1_008950 [Rhinolophus ferrumequinum]
MQVGTHVAPDSFKDLGAFQPPHQPLLRAQMVLVPPYLSFPLKPLSQHRQQRGGTGWLPGTDGPQTTGLGRNEESACTGSCPLLQADGRKWRGLLIRGPLTPLVTLASAPEAGRASGQHQT